MTATPNHALQRTAVMSVPSRSSAVRSTVSVTGCAAHHEAPAQPAPSPRAAVLTAPASGPLSLSLGSLGVLAQLPRKRSQEDSEDERYVTPSYPIPLLLPFCSELFGGARPRASRPALAVPSRH